MSEVSTERIYTIHIGKLPQRWRRSEKAIFLIRNFLARHMKVPLENVKLDPSINEEVFRRGGKKPPRRIKVRAVKFEDGVVEAELAK